MADQPGWPEETMKALEGEVGYRVRIAMRAHSISVLTEMTYDVRAIPSEAREGLAQLLEAKIAQLRKLNRIDTLQRQEQT